MFICYTFRGSATFFEKKAYTLPSNERFRRIGLCVGPSSTARRLFACTDYDAHHLQSRAVTKYSDSSVLHGEMLFIVQGINVSFSCQILFLNNFFRVYTVPTAIIKNIIFMPC